MLTDKQLYAWNHAGETVCMLGQEGANPGRRAIRDMFDGISKRDAGWLANFCRLHDYDAAVIRRTLGLNGQARPVLERSPHLVVDPVPDPEEPLDELIGRRCNHYKRLEKAQHDEIVVRISEPGPIGILIFGDPHLDDDGTNLPLVKAHLDLINRTPGLFGGCIGDTHNGWVGRMARLYGEQGTTQREAWRLVEWFFGSVEWAILVGGNHDADWHGANNPLDWIVKQAGAAHVYRPNDTRIRLEGPDWDRSFRIWARHDFPGRSQWNPMHGLSKAAKMRDDYRADFYIAGHTHDPGLQWEPRSHDGADWYAMRLGAYKTYDDYADEKGFPTKAGGEAMMIVIDGQRKYAFTDVFAGAEFLTWKRSRR